MSADSPPIVDLRESGLAGLIERVEKATGPDRLLDTLIAVTTQPERYRRYEDIEDMVWELGGRGEHWLTTTPHYTASLDAVVALVETELPWWSWIIGKFPTVRAELAEPVMTKFGPGIGIRAQEKAATPALALLLAFLRAKSGQHSDER